MHPMVNIAVRAARSAGSIIVRSMDRMESVRVETKGRNDFVSEVDRAAEQEIMYILRKAYPDHAIIGEETGEHGEGEYQWIIDPLDGTTNFLHGFPQFAVSIAMKYRGRLEAGVIYNPLSQELFTANRGGGALLDGRRIRVSQRKGLEGALIGTGFPFRKPELLDPYTEMFRKLAEKVGDMRRPGAASLDLAFVAAGRLDGFWEMGLKPWDIAAGSLLIQEAGGVVGDFTGGGLVEKTGDIIAGNPKVFSGLVSNLRPIYQRMKNGD